VAPSVEVMVAKASGLFVVDSLPVYLKLGLNCTGKKKKRNIFAS
jgi:hypothetical protein